MWRQDGGGTATQALIGVGMHRTGPGILPTPPHNGGPNLLQIDIGKLIGEGLEVLQVAGEFKYESRPVDPRITYIHALSSLMSVYCFSHIDSI